MNKEKIISEHMAALGAKRWKKIPKKVRKEEMRNLVNKRWAKRAQELATKTGEELTQ
jgi:hypothetical protein